MLPKHKKTGGYRIRPYGIEKEYEQIVRTPFVFLGIYYPLRVLFIYSVSVSEPVKNLIALSGASFALPQGSLSYL